ncbi:hypothetical protein EBU58_02840 [bacterium]|nr:hypothetical protein [bacterium]
MSYFSIGKSTGGTAVEDGVWRTLDQGPDGDEQQDQAGEQEGHGIGRAAGPAQPGPWIVEERKVQTAEGQSLCEQWKCQPPAARGGITAADNQLRGDPKGHKQRESGVDQPAEHRVNDRFSKG